LRENKIEPLFVERYEIQAEFQRSIKGCNADIGTSKFNRLCHLTVGHSVQRRAANNVLRQARFAQLSLKEFVGACAGFARNHTNAPSL
jgi:hypothetical protein